MRYSVTMIVDPGATDLVPDDERLIRTLDDLDRLFISPVTDSREIEIDLGVESPSLLGAISDATSIVERRLEDVFGARAPRIIAVNAHEARP
ncbi:MAG: hypothetical protein QOD65_3877 [Gaiellales bacterium]|nr:hypothetical protein [Gaiellales bacterium]